jgi:very-short-patch-repair endonuclease
VDPVQGRGDSVDAWWVNPKLKLVAESQGGVFSRGQAIESGYTLEQIRERVGDRRWERVRYGQYAEAVDLSGLAPWDRRLVRHERLIHAVMNSLAPDSVAVSHQSALVLHGVPLWGVELDEVQVTRLDRRHGGPIAGVRHHRGKVTTADLTEVNGLPTTTIARAVVETACTASFEAAVVSADAAVRDHQVSAEVMLQLLDVVEFWPGSPTARAAMGFCNGHAESVGESRLRVLIHNHGLPVPLLQFRFVDSDGFVARVDFYFPGQRTVVEFDGLVKYSGGSPNVLVEEKFREDRLRALGVEVVRITWADLDRPGSVVARIRQAFTRAARTA